MKELLSKTWIKILLIVAIFLGGLLLVGKCEKASAENFVLSDGTVSQVTYNEHKELRNGNNKYMTITKPGTVYAISIVSTGTTGFIDNYLNCNYDNTNNTITCNTLVDSFGNVVNLETSLIIYEDKVHFNNASGSQSVFFLDTRFADQEELQIMAATAELKWNNLLNWLNDKINFTDEQINFVLGNWYNGSFDEKEEYFMELIEARWEQAMSELGGIPQEEVEAFMQQAITLCQLYDESMNSILDLINDKINFTTEEFINVDLMGEGVGFENPKAKAEYYINLINQRWDSYLSENGTGGGYTQEQVDEMMMEFYSMVDMIEISWDNTLKFINEKIGFTEEEIIHMLTDENGTFETPEAKVEYYNNLINQRWNVYLNEVKSTVDITTDNQAYADKYINDNNYHTNDEYLNYGSTQYINGYNNATIGYLNIVKNKVSTLFPDYTILENTCSTTTSGSIVCDDAFKDYVQKTYNWSNNIGYENGVANADITIDNQEYANKYIIDNNYHSNSEYLNYGTTKYNDGLTNGKALGYEQANNDGEVLGSFIPNLLGGFGSFFLTIMNIDILGFNLLTLFGILITILGIIVVIKFLKG